MEKRTTYSIASTVKGVDYAPKTPGFTNPEDAIELAKALTCQIAIFSVYKREETLTKIFNGEEYLAKKIAAGIGDNK